MQNYFDPNDRRSRENPFCLEAQLLNLAAVPLEDLDLRITREINQTLQTVPLNIDNQGVYFGSRIPQDLLTDLNQTVLNSVTGHTGDVARTLVPFDDTLPVPTRLEVIESVALSEPILFTIIGTGDEISQEFAVQYVEPGEFPIPNKLTLWMDQVGLNQAFVTLTIVGQVVPKPAWAAERKLTTEVMNITREGISYTRNRWASIQKIAVRGLPNGVRLRGWSMPFNLPAAHDLMRPVTLPEDRQVLYNRYWDVNGGLLREMYMSGGLGGLELYSSYAISDPLISVAPEPYTYGMYSISESTLYYSDRREIVPRLDDTGLAVEPLFGLQISNDISKTGDTRYVILSAIPYSKADQILQYRYLMIKHGSVQAASAILPDGSLAPGDRGWRAGKPTRVSVPLLESGDYQFKLELQDTSGVTTVDVVPWRNASFSPETSIDISGLISTPKAVAFDSYGNLWVWTGSFAIRLRIHCDAYVLDIESQTIFTTDQYDLVQIS